MFKFKALIAKKGNYFYNERFIPYKNSEVITEDKEEAEYLRNNRGFEEVIEKKSEEKTATNAKVIIKPVIVEVKVESTIKEVAEEKKEISELEKLKAEAIRLGLKPHHKAGVEKIKEMIEEFVLKDIKIETKTEKIKENEYEVKLSIKNKKEIEEKLKIEEGIKKEV